MLSFQYQYMISMQSSLLSLSGRRGGDWGRRGGDWGGGVGVGEEGWGLGRRGGDWGGGVGVGGYFACFTDARPDQSKKVFLPPL